MHMATLTGDGHPYAAAIGVGGKNRTWSSEGTPGNAILADPKLHARLAELGGEPMPMTPAEFGELVAEETEKWGKVIRAANIKAD